jgi:hypothetical protein
MPEIDYQLRAKLDLPACIGFPKQAGELKLRLPFGITLASIRDSTLWFQSAGQLVSRFIGQLQPVLAPLMSILIIVDAIKKIAGFLQAFVDALGPPPDVALILEALEAVLEAVIKLAVLVPPFNYIPPIVDLAIAITLLLEAIIGSVDQVILATQRQLDFEASVDLNPLLGEYSDCVLSSVTAQTDGVAFVARTSASLFFVLGSFLDLIGDVPGVKDLVKPVKDVVDIMANLQSEDITPDLVPVLKDVQNVLTQVRVTLEPLA